MVESDDTNGPQITSVGLQLVGHTSAWWLWKHHNADVFEEASPSVQKIIQDIKADARLWCLLGAKEMSKLWP
jgi:predicted negative regulator of RcsB-dependent stress response